MVNKPEENDSDVNVADPDQEVSTERRDQLKEPPQYAVVLHNDDYTTMEFVVEVLKKFFHKTEEEALRIMLRIHQEGEGVAGIYSYEIAETKAVQVNQVARARGFPLKCTVEPT